MNTQLAAVSEHPKKIFLVDGSGYIFRAFFGVPHLSTKDGFPTNALLGFTRMLGRLLNDPEATHVIVVFDAGRKTFRNDLYSEYKANRAECPDELVPQMPFFREIARALGLQVLESPGYEADDIIGTLVRRYEEGGCEIVIVSGDKDLSQLVDARVSVWDTMKDKRFGAEGVIEKFGVGPEKVVDVLALMGDSSDNVPGIHGVGPKTAAQLVQLYGSVEEIISNIENVRTNSAIRGRAKIADTLAANIEKLRLSRRLVEILTEAPFDVQLDGAQRKVTDLSYEELFEASRRRAPVTEQLSALFARFEFSSLLKDMNLSLPATTMQDSASNYHTIFAEEFDPFVERLEQQGEFAFDIETTALDPYQAQLVGASFCWSADEAFYIPIGHKVCITGKTQVSLELFKEKLGPILLSAKHRKVGQNLKYDISVLAALGIPVEAVWFDTMVAAYLLNPDKNAYNMTALAREYLNRSVIEYDDLDGVEENFSNVSIEHATRYAAEDAHVAWLLKDVLEPKLEAHNLTSVFRQIEMPLVPVLSRMELAGVRLDTGFLESMGREFGAELDEIRERLYKLAGTEFNLNSPKQLADILFGKLGISTKGVKKTKTGFSTDSSVLELLSEQHEFPREVLRYRMLFKLKSTYVDALPLAVNPVTLRLHSRFNQTVTATGRLSSSDPNLQNIPIQSKEGRRIRGAFIGEAGTVLLSADYSQIELRILAHMSGDTNLIDAFVHDTDIHAKTAREIFQVPEGEEVPSELRRIGKTLNFGIIYGMSGFRLSKELGIGVREGDTYIEQYFARYPRVKELFSRLEHEAQTQGFVTTVFGRKRFISQADLGGRDRGFQNRIAVNAPIQGTAADVVKLAMITIDRRINDERLPLKMILQVHDELVFEAPEREAATMVALVKEEMEQVCSLLVPLRVEVGMGKNWEEAH